MLPAVGGAILGGWKLRVPREGLITRDNVFSAQESCLGMGNAES